MRTSILALLLVLSSPPLAHAQGLAGDWIGTLDVGAVRLRVVFHISETSNGPTATLDSLDQGARGIPVTTVSRDGSSIKLQVNQIGGAFAGRIDDDGLAIAGTWTQPGGSLPLKLTRVTDPATLELRRPQNPTKPYPYHEEEVSYGSKSIGVRLAATLTLPEGKGPFPAVVLITGSGAQDRDETLLGHRPFLVLADHLTRHGLAVLRADDRGVGKSGGNFETATTQDFADDAEGGFAYLQTRPEIDRQKIGLIGHSEGGVIAPIVAARNHGVAFIVLMAGSGVAGDQIILAQSELIAKAAGASAEQIAQNTAQQRQLFAILKQEQDPTLLEAKLRQLLAGVLPEPQLGAQIKAATSPWYRYFISYDPAVALKRVTVPVLAISGTKDLQVPPGLNLPAIRVALEAGGNKNVEVAELPGLNHLFQTAVTGAPSEYGTIEETLSPLALERIAGWIGRQR